jgi:hypothetical protein
LRDNFKRDQATTTTASPLHRVVAERACFVRATRGSGRLSRELVERHCGVRALERDCWIFDAVLAARLDRG